MDSSLHHEFNYRAIAQKTTDELWRILIDGNISSASTNTVFGEIIKRSIEQDSKSNSSVLLSIAEGFKTEVGQLTRQMKSEKIPSFFTKKSLDFARQKQGRLTDEMRSIAGSAYLNLLRTQLDSGRCDTAAVQIVFKIYGELAKNNSVPKDIRKQSKFFFKDASETILRNAVSSGEWETVVLLSSVNLKRFAKYVEPEMYSLVSSAKEQLNDSFRNCVEISVKSGRVYSLLQIIENKSVPDEIRQNACVGAPEATQVYLKERIQFFQKNPMIGSIGPLARDISTSNLPGLVPNWGDVFAKLLVEHLRFTLNIPSNEQEQLQIWRAAQICVGGIAALDPKRMKDNQVSIISMLEAAYSKSTETRKKEILQTLDTLGQEARYPGYFEGQRSIPNSISDLAAQASERLKSQLPILPRVSTPVTNGPKKLTC